MSDQKRDLKTIKKCRQPEDTKGIQKPKAIKNSTKFAQQKHQTKERAQKSIKKNLNRGQITAIMLK